MARQGSLPQRTTSRRREPGPLSDSEQRAKAQHIDKVHERLRSRGLQPREPRDMGLGNQFDCQFNSVMLALLHPMIAGAMRPAPQGRREQPNADTAKQQRKKVKQWCYDNYNNLAKNKPHTDIPWYTVLDIAQVHHQSKAAWKTRTNQYAPGPTQDYIKDRAFGDNLSLFALANIHNCTIIVHRADEAMERFQPALSPGRSQYDIHLVHYQTTGYTHFGYATLIDGEADPAAGAEPEAGASSPGAAAQEQFRPSSSGGAGGARARVASPRAASHAPAARLAHEAPAHMPNLGVMYPGARQLHQEALASLRSLQHEGHIQQPQVATMENRMLAYFESLPDIDLGTLKSNNPYQFLGKSVTEPFELGGGELADFDGVIIGYGPHAGVDQYQILYSDNQMLYRKADRIEALVRLHSANQARVRDQVPGHNARVQEPGHVLFAAMRADPGTVAANARDAGGFQFLAEKFASHALFELRDARQHLPVPTAQTNTVIMEAMREVLAIASWFPMCSDERYIMREFSQIALTLLYAYGPHADNVAKASRIFNKGEWQRLWLKVQETHQSKRAQLANKPRVAAKRTDQAKDAYAIKLAQAGNLGKANAIVTKDSVPALTADTVEKLKAKHPQRPLDQNRQFWRSDAESTAFWESDDGRELAQQAFSIKKIKKFFCNRPPRGAPDLDGWRCREIIAFMFKNDDTELHELIRTELILPYIYGDFHPDHLEEKAGGLLFAFYKANGVDTRPLCCGSAFRRCAAALLVAHLKCAAHKYFTTTIPNFVQCAGGLPDGASRCAFLLQMLFEREEVQEAVGAQVWPRAICQLDARNAYNEDDRSAAMDALCGIASKPYDDGRVQPGDAIVPTFKDVQPFFSYFKSMHSTASMLRFEDEHGAPHHLKGTTGGQQGDPAEGLKFAASVHPTWSRLYTHSPSTTGVAFMDDAFAEDELPSLLRFMRDSMHAFDQDHKLTMQASKCKIHVKGVDRDTAHALILQCIDADASLECLRPVLERKENPADDVIQADGLRVAGVPIGSSEFVTKYIESKRDDILNDLPKLDVVTDDLVHAHLLVYCQHPRFRFLGRNLPPEVMAAADADALSPPAQIHQTVIDELMRRGTADKAREWPADVKRFCAHVLERPPHKAGHGITPLQESGKAGFYSATARFVSWLARLDSRAHWLPDGQDLTDPDTWKNSRLLALKDLHQSLINQHGFREWAPPPAGGPAAAPAPIAAGGPAAGAAHAPLADQPANADAVAPSLPPLNLLATIQAFSQEADDDDDAERRQDQAKLLSQREVTKQIMTHRHANAPAAPWTRGQQMLALRHKQTIPTLGQAEGPGVSDPSILQSIMPHQVADDDAGADAAAGAGNAPKRHMLTHAPAGCTLAGPMYMTWRKPRLGKTEYQAWFCQQLGLEPPCLTPHLGQPCPCGLYTIDADHLHTCKIHSGNWYAAHEHLLSAVEEIVRISGYRVKRRYVDSSKGGKTRGDLQFNLQIGNQRQTVVDVAMVHDFHGAVDNPGNHGQPRHPHNPDRVLIDAAKRKVSHYRRDYQRLDTAFLPLIASTSGRLHAEFVRLLYFLAHQRALAFFAKIGQQNPSHKELCQRRGAFFYQHRARIGIACAQACALRIGGGVPPRRRAVPVQGRWMDELYFDQDIQW